MRKGQQHKERKVVEDSACEEPLHECDEDQHLVLSCPRLSLCPSPASSLSPPVIHHHHLALFETGVSGEPQEPDTLHRAEDSITEAKMHSSVLGDVDETRLQPRMYFYEEKSCSTGSSHPSPCY